MRLRTITIPFVVFLTTLAALSRTIRPAFASATFADDTFADADWSYQKIVDQTPGQTATVVSQQIAAGGNPGAYRSTTHHWCDDGTGVQDIVVRHLRNGFVWDPAVDGPIASLAFSYDVIFAPFGNPDAVGYHLAVVQNGNLYIRTAFATSPTWTTISASGLHPSDFTTPYASGAPPLDFSASGAPLQFGYVTSNGTAFAECVTTSSGIDNFSLTISPAEICDNGVDDDGNGYIDDDDPACDYLDGFSDGQLVRESPDAQTYIVYGGAKFVVPDGVTFDAMGFSDGDVDVVPAGSLAVVSSIPRDGTVIKEFSDGIVYFISGGVRMRIPDATTFEALKLQWDEIDIVPDGALSSIPLGGDIGPQARSCRRATAANASLPPLSSSRFCPAERNVFRHVANRCSPSVGPFGGGCLEVKQRCRKIKGLITPHVFNRNLPSQGDADMLFNLYPDQAYKWTVQRWPANNDEVAGLPGPQRVVHCEIVASDLARNCRGRSAGDLIDFSKVCPADDFFDGVGGQWKDVCTVDGPFSSQHAPLPLKCTGNNVKRPNRAHGQAHVQVTGALVTDNKHGAWIEIHPVWHLRYLRDLTEARAAKAFGATPAARQCSTRCCDGFEEVNGQAVSEDECMQHAYDVCLPRDGRGAKRVSFDACTVFSNRCTAVGGFAGIGDIVGPIDTPQQACIASVQCDGTSTGGGTEWHGSVGIEQAPDAWEVDVQLVGAEPFHTYSIEAWEAADVCGDNDGADTGTRITTDGGGRGYAQFDLPRGWAPLGAVLGDGLGTESLVVTLDRNGSSTSCGDSFVTQVPVHLPQAPH